VFERNLKKELKFSGDFAFFIYVGPVCLIKIFKKELKFLGCFALFSRGTMEAFNYFELFF
jgi:hypothetical protein